MNLKEEIIKIVQLQEIDSKIYQMQEKKDSKFPIELKTLESEFEQKKLNLSDAEEKLKEMQLKKKDTELELATKEENARKAQGHLYQLKTNKEYQAKLNEINSLKADISVAEEEVLKILDGVDAAKKEVATQKEKLSQDEKAFKDAQGAISNHVKDLDAQIKNLQEKRQQFTDGVDKEIISKYEQLLQTRQGLAVVPVQNSNCRSCHLRVTHQKVNEIKMFDKLVFCENCVRILYIPEDIKL
tara:strand:+ start:73 stop:798 length:726 start_codon:yes stop_codon:yes gene_type:complete